MANQITINIGAAANDGTGDPLRTAFNDVNLNFANVWNTGLPSSNVQFSDNRILTVNTNANLVLAPNGIGIVQSNVDILPSINRGQSLGSTVKKWNTVNSYYINADVANVGSFGNLTVAVANLHITGGSNGYVLQTDGAGNLTWTAQTGGSGNGTPGGANTQVQFNDAGSFGGSAAFTFNKTSNVLTLNGNISAGNAAITNLTSSNRVNARTGTFTGDQFSDGAMYVGNFAGTTLGSDVVIQITANSGSYSQTNFQNINSGVRASSDYILTADNGNDTTHFLDMGITSSNWDGSETNVLAGLTPNNGYLYVQDGNLTVGTRTGNVSRGWKFDTLGTLTVPGNIVPTANATQSLGTSTLQWKDLWVSGNTIYMNSVPISLGAGNVLTVNGNDVVTTAANGVTDFDSITMINTPTGPSSQIKYGLGNLVVWNDGGWTIGEYNGTDYGTEGIRINPGIEGSADIVLPSDPANVPVQVNNYSGNVRIQTAGGFQWTFDTNGNLNLAGRITSDGTIDIDNRASGNSADIRLYAADDILLQARDRTLGSGSEGGDINIYAGDSAEDGDASGGDVQIYAGNGGPANVDFGGSGGFVTIQGGQGGAASTGVSGYGAEGGGALNLRAGDAGSNNGNIDRGAGGGNMFIEAGDSTGNGLVGGSIFLVTGLAGPNAQAGDLQIQVPSSDGGPGGTWYFNATGNLITPGNINATGAVTGANLIANSNFVGTRLATNLTDFNWSDPIVGITLGTNTYVTLDNNVFGDPWQGQVTISGVGGTSEANGNWYYLAVDSNQFELFSDANATPVDSSEWGTYTSGGIAYTLGYNNLEINGQNITIRSDHGDYNNKIWRFNSNGFTVFPYMDTPRGDTTGGNITGYTLRMGDGTAQAIITTPDGDPTGGQSSQRLVINPGKGADGTSGEGGDIYLWAGRGGDAGGSGGDIKIRGGQGMGEGGAGGYIRMEAGDGDNTGGQAGYIEITGGTGGTGGNSQNGGYVRILGGQGALAGGDANITGGVGQGGPGGPVNITGGTSGNGLAEYGNVNITSGASTWTFNNTGTLIVPGEGVVRSINNTIVLQSYDSANSIGRGLRIGDNGGLYLEQGSAPTWLTISPFNSNAEITGGSGTGGGAGKNITITAGAADLTDYYTTPGGNLNLQGGTGAGNDGGGGGPGGSVNITSGFSNDPAGRYGNVTINTGISTTWNFDYTGNVSVPGSIITASGSGGNISGANVISANVFVASGNITGANLIATANVLGNGYARFAGTFDESQASTAGLYLGYAGGTPRMMFGTGNTLQTFEIDNDGGNLRFYQPGSTKATLTPSGVFIANVTVTTPTALSSLTAVAGARAFVNNGNLAAAGNFGARIGGGGSNTVPVWSDGTNWYIG